MAPKPQPTKIRAVIFASDILLMDPSDDFQIHAAPKPGSVELLENLLKLSTSGVREGLQFGLILNTPYPNHAHFSLIPKKHRILPLTVPSMPTTRPDLHQQALKVISDTVVAKKEQYLQPREVLVLEQSARGVIAARRAGMQVIWIPDDEEAKEFADMEEAILESEKSLDVTEFWRGEEILVKQWRPGMHDWTGKATKLNNLAEFDMYKWLANDDLARSIFGW